MFRAPERGQIALALAGADGGTWTLTMSAGTERFIGRYPRVERIADAGQGPLLDFRAVHPGC